MINQLTLTPQITGKLNIGLMIKASIIGFLSEWHSLIWDLRWMITLGFLLIISDLWFGISDSKYHNTPVEFRNAFKRTFNKVVDYTCYVLVGAVLGKAIAEPYGIDPIVSAITVMIFCYGFELDSIYGHICSLHDIKKEYSIWELLWFLVTFRFMRFGNAFKSLREQIKSKPKKLTKKKKI